MQLLAQRRDVLIVVALFVASRLLYAALGLHFDASPFPAFMQFIDRDLLANRLLESLWYFHANPPLLNLLAGVGVKVFGSHAGDFFAATFHVIGLAFAYAIYSLTRRLSGSNVAAHVTCAVLVFNPAFVLYENWFMYSFPAAAALGIAALLLHRYLQTGAMKWAAAFFWTLAILLLTRSVFHLVWLVAVTVLLVAAPGARRKQILAAAALPILVVGLWYGKNAYLFGSFSASSWFGLGLSNITTLVLTREELEPLVERGELSRYALVNRYLQVDKLFTSETLSPTGIPVLDQVRKSTGQYNWNSQQIMAIDHYYAADGIAVARHFPASYAVGMIIANRLFFSPTDMNEYFAEDNRRAAWPMQRIFYPVLNGVGPRPDKMTQPVFGFNTGAVLQVNTSAWLILWWWVLLGYGYVQMRKGVVGRGEPDRPRSLVIGFIAFTALYVYAIGTAFELGENYRYRWLVEPLMFVLAAVAVTDLVRWLRRRLASHTPLASTDPAA